MTAVVGVGGLVVRAGKADHITMLGVGSCVAVIAVDVNRGVGGMAHVVLPRSDPSDPVVRLPAYYADRAIPALIRELRANGSVALPGHLRIRLVGGASPSGIGMQIGLRNVAAVKQALARYGFAVAAEDVGGTHSRTVTMVLPYESVTVVSPEHGEKIL